MDGGQGSEVQVQRVREAGLRLHRHRREDAEAILLGVCQEARVGVKDAFP